MRGKLFVFALTAACAFAQGDRNWVLETSTIVYHVSHPLHQSEGTSHEARGKGVCHAGQCDFLVAVPVKSFVSGDSNRDLHMLQVTRGAQYPMVTVRVKLPESAANDSTIQADLEVQFAGQTAQYKAVALQRTGNGGQSKITATIPAKMTDFEIEPPSLLAIPTKDELPIRVEMTWKQM